MPTVRPRGDKFQAIVRIKKNGSIVFQESRMFSKPELAKDWGRRLEKAVKADAGAAHMQKRVTLGKLMRDHLEKLEQHNSVRRTRSAEISQVAGYFDNLQLSDMTPLDFTRFADKRRKEGAGPATVLHNLAVVRSALKAAPAVFGIQVGVEPLAQAVDALQRVGTVARSENRDRRPSPQELAALVKDFERMSFHPSTILPMQIIVPLAIEFPRRRGELLDMRWDDLNRRRKIITLRDTKHPHKPRTEQVPLSPAALVLIDRLPVVDERILPFKEESVSASFQRACSRLKIEDLHFHDLRHEGITRLFEQGYSIQEVAVVSGHMSWQMLRRYTHLEAENLAKKMHKDNTDAGE